MFNWETSRPVNFWTKANVTSEEAAPAPFFIFSDYRAINVERPKRDDLYYNFCFLLYNRWTESANEMRQLSQYSKYVTVWTTEK
jgi:hypothetical protein